MFEKKVEGVIELGTKGIKLMAFEKNKIKKISFFDYNALYQGVFVNVQQSLAKVTDLEVLKNKNIALTLPITEFFYKTIKIDLKSKDLNNEIRRVLESNIKGYKVDDYAQEIIILEDNLEGQNKYSKILVLAIKESILNSYVNIMKSFHMEVIKITPDIISLLNLFTELEDQIISKKSGKIFENMKVEQLSNDLIVDLGTETTKLIFRSKSKLRDFKILKWGGVNITEIVMEEEMIEYKEAEKVKKSLFEFGFNKDEEATEEAKKVKNELESVTRNIGKAIIDYEESNEKIEKIYLVGGGSLIEGFNSYIHETLNKKCELVDHNYLESLCGSQRQELSTLLGLIIKEVN